MKSLLQQDSWPLTHILLYRYIIIVPWLLWWNPIKRSHVIHENIFDLPNFIRKYPEILPMTMSFFTNFGEYTEAQANKRYSYLWPDELRLWITEQCLKGIDFWKFNFYKEWFHKVFEVTNVDIRNQSGKLLNNFFEKICKAAVYKLRNGK